MELTLDPDRMRTRSQKFPDPRWAGGKYYCTIFTISGYTRASRAKFRRASQAEAYGQRVIAYLRKVKHA